MVKKMVQTCLKKGQERSRMVNTVKNGQCGQTGQKPVRKGKKRSKRVTNGQKWSKKV